MDVSGLKQTSERMKLKQELQEVEAGSTCPPLVVENILAVPPHCFTYHKNQRAETSWGSEVTSTFTNRVAKLLAALEQIKKVS